MAERLRIGDRVQAKAHFYLPNSTDVPVAGPGQPGVVTGIWQNGRSEGVQVDFAEYWSAGRFYPAITIQTEDENLVFQRPDLADRGAVEEWLDA